MTARRARRVLLLGLLSVLALSGCGQLNSIPFDPPQTPATWLAIQPVAELNIAAQTVILVQPSTTAIVCLLGLLTIGVGLYFWRIRDGQASRRWRASALLLWGIDALLAGKRRLVKLETRHRTVLETWMMHGHKNRRATCNP